MRCTELDFRGDIVHPFAVAEARKMSHRDMRQVHQESAAKATHERVSAAAAAALPAQIAWDGCKNGSAAVYVA